MAGLPILIIEEDASLAQFIAHMLRARNYVPVVASSLVQALRLMAGQTYGLVVADYFSPSEQALYRWPMLQVLARFAPDIPAIVTSSSSQAPIVDNVVDILPLPFDEVELIRKVRRHAITTPKGSREPFLLRYLAAVLDADENDAAKVVTELESSGWVPSAIYEDIFASALYAIGDWWGSDSCSVADEHGALAITERLMARISLSVRSKSANGHRVLVACLAGEAHEVGARMAADFFSWDGWSVRFLGANVPEAEMVADARRRNIEVVGLSATIRPGWELMKAQIAGLHEAGVSRVIIGGQALWWIDSARLDALGAVGKAANASDGLEMANKLVGRRSSAA